MIRRPTRRRAGSVAATMLFLVGCVSSDIDPPLLCDVALSPNPNPAVPLAAVLSLVTNEPTQVTVRIDDGERDWNATESNGFAYNHSLTLLGMRANREHAVTALVTDEAGNTSESASLVFRTPALPHDIPNPRVTASMPERMEPGVTVFSVIRRSSDGTQPPDYGALVIVDDRGEVIWYYRNNFGAQRPRRLSNGNLVFIGGRSRIVEIDMLGNVVRRWHARRVAEVPEGSIPVETDTFHHEVVELPWGNLLALSSEARVLSDYPTSDTDPDASRTASTVIGDVAVEFDTDGSVVRRWSLLDALDPYRIGLDSLEGDYWSAEYEDMAAAAPLRDWSHSNSVTYDPGDDSIIVSARYQDAVIKLDRESGDVVWILGTHLPLEGALEGVLARTARRPSVAIPSARSLARWEWSVRQRWTPSFGQGFVTAKVESGS